MNEIMTTLNRERRNSLDSPTKLKSERSIERGESRSKREKFKFGFLLKRGSKQKDFKKRFYQIKQGYFQTVKIDKHQRALITKTISQLELLNYNDANETEIPLSFELTSP
jgi:hypothetical protein